MNVGHANKQGVAVYKSTSMLCYEWPKLRIIEAFDLLLFLSPAAEGLVHAMLIIHNSLGLGEWGTRSRSELANGARVVQVVHEPTPNFITHLINQLLAFGSLLRLLQLLLGAGGANFAVKVLGILGVPNTQTHKHTQKQSVTMYKFSDGFARDTC